MSALYAESKRVQISRLARDTELACRLLRYALRSDDTDRIYREARELLEAAATAYGDAIALVAERNDPGRAASNLATVT